MATESLAIHSMSSLKRPIEAVYLADNEEISFFYVYLEFILNWTQTDVESYGNAGNLLPDGPEKNLLLYMSSRKNKTFDVLSNYCETGYFEWYQSMFGQDSEPVVIGNKFDQDLQLIQCLEDAFYFAYRREYQGLTIFEKVGRSNLEKEIRDLMEHAAEHQRQHILYLDNMLCKVTLPNRHHSSVVPQEQRPLMLQTAIRRI